MRRNDDYDEHDMPDRTNYYYIANLLLDLIQFSKEEADEILITHILKNTNLN